MCEDPVCRDAQDVVSFAWERLKNRPTASGAKLMSSGRALVVGVDIPRLRTAEVLKFLESMNNVVNEAATAIQLLGEFYNDFLMRRMRGETIKMNPDVIDRVGKFLVNYHNG